MADDTLVDGYPGFQRGQTFFDQGDPRVKDWAIERIQEGERINRADPIWSKMDSLIEYVMGEQLDPDRPEYLPRLVLNYTKKSIRASVATHTDLKPLFEFRTNNPQFQRQATLLNQNTVVWWINTQADADLADIVKYSATVGTGDVLVEYDPDFNRFGDTRLIPRDPRDTLPIQPTRSRSIQDWQGVAIREGRSIHELTQMYPTKAHLIQRPKMSNIGQLYSKFRQVITPRAKGDENIFSRLQAKHSVEDVLPECIIYRLFVDDFSINTTGVAVSMGAPGTSWAYRVEPGQRLYPRKRLIVVTENGTLWDGPSPYWHGMFPVARLKLDAWPWSFFGLPVANDLKPLQDSINRVAQDFLSTFSQWANRGTIADKNSVPEGLLKQFDPRKPNWKMKLNPTFGDGFKLAEGPTLPTWAMDFFLFLTKAYEEHSGKQNLQAMLSLRQMPSADTIKTYWEAMTPELRLEGRQIELLLREIAEMFKCNMFQFYTSKRRQILSGDAGLAIEDFDYDPGNMVPAMGPEDEGYVAELDAGVDRDLRAQHFMKMFAFHVAPNSMLAMHSVERKMAAVQMSRQGYMDFWTFHEVMETPNVGAPPPIPLPVPPDVPEEKLAEMGAFQDPETGAWMVNRIPETITERLQAQQMLGIGMTESPVGRKASGQQPPELKRKPDGEGGERVTVSESG